MIGNPALYRKVPLKVANMEPLVVEMELSISTNKILTGLKLSLTTATLYKNKFESYVFYRSLAL
jgi:hypothetical protein